VTDAEKSPVKDEGLLVSVAESIGSTLGTLVAKASAAQKSFGKSAKATTQKVIGSGRPARRKRIGGNRRAKRRAKSINKPEKAKVSAARRVRAKKNRGRAK
jgi:hypothetical protein